MDTNMGQPKFNEVLKDFIDVILNAVIDAPGSTRQWS